MVSEGPLLVPCKNGQRKSSLSEVGRFIPYHFNKRTVNFPFLLYFLHFSAESTLRLTGPALLADSVWSRWLTKFNCFYDSVSGQLNFLTFLTISIHLEILSESVFGLEGTLSAHPQKFPPGSFLSFKITNAVIAGAPIAARCTLISPSDLSQLPCGSYHCPVICLYSSERFL